MTAVALITAIKETRCIKWISQNLLTIICCFDRTDIWWCIHNLSDGISSLAISIREYFTEINNFFWTLWVPIFLSTLLVYEVGWGAAWFAAWLICRIFNLLKPTGHVMHQQFNIQQLYVLPTHCIYVFCIYLRTNSDLCHLQHKLIGFYHREEKCLLRGTNWVFK